MSAKRKGTGGGSEWLTGLDNGRYQLQEWLTSHVCLASDLDGSQVVVKHQEYPGPDGIPTYDSYETEIKLHSTLKHPRLAEFVRAHPAEHVIVTRWIPGESLGRRFFLRPCPEPEVVDILIDVAEAVAYLNEQGAVHRDITPANVVYNDGRVTLVDLGAAETLGPKGTTRIDPMTVLIDEVERFAWARPQEWSDYGLDSEVCFLGLLGVFLLDGFPPVRDFFKDNYSWASIVTSSRELQAILRRAVSKARGDRFQSTREMLVALRACQHSMSGGKKGVSVPLCNKQKTKIVDAAVPTSASQRNISPGKSSADPDATRLADPALPPEADREVKTRREESHTVNTDRTIVKKQSVPTEWKVGDVILDLYEVKEILGEGGFGRVYKVHHREWNTDLAVKSPRAEAFQSQAQRENFVRECETWIQLGMHPHIVSCYYVRSINGVPHVFAEYVEGGNLHDWIEDRRLYEGEKDEALRRMLDISIQFAWGLQYAHVHEQCLVHQDVKPGNVLITPEGETKVTDFGLARARASTNTGIDEAKAGRTILVTTGGMTPAYCSPEQAEGKPLSRKTDIWSWGLSVLEMFSGGRTWRSGTLAMVALDEYCKNGINDDSIPRMPGSLVKLLNDCFQQEPKDRPDNFKEIADRLRAIYEEEGKFGEYPRQEPKVAELLADSLNNRALSMLELGKGPEAEKAWDAALAADPHHPEATYNRGLRLWRLGQIRDTELIVQFDEAHVTHSETSRLDYLRGLIHLEQGAFASAVDSLEAAERVATDDSDVQRALQVARLHANSFPQEPVRLSQHPYWVRSIAMSPDGGLLLSASLTGTLQRHDLEAPGETRVLQAATQGIRIECVAISSDARLAAISGEFGVHVWDVQSARCLRELADTRRFENQYSLNFTRDNRFLLASGRRGVRLFEISSGALVWAFYEDRGIVGPATLNPDGESILFARGANVEIWNPRTGTMLTALCQHSRMAQLIACAPDGKHFAVVDRDVVHLHRLSDGKCAKKFEGFVVPHGQAATITSIALSSNGRFLLSGSSLPDEGLRLWDISTGRCLRTFRQDGVAVNAVAFSPDSRFVIWGTGDNKGNNDVWFWKITQGCSQQPALSRPHKQATVYANAERVRLFILKAQEALDNGDPEKAFGVSEAAREVPGYSKDDRTLTIRTKAGLLGRIVRLDAGWQTRTPAKHIAEVRSAVLSQDGERFLTATEYPDHTVRLWETRTGRCVHTLKGHKSGIMSLWISRNGSLGVSGGADYTIRVWDLKTGKCLRILEDQRGYVKSICASGDERLLLSASGRALRLWDISSWKCLRSIKGQGFESASISGDGRWGFSANGHQVKLWDLESGTCLRVFKGHRDDVFSVRMNADSQYGLSASKDGTLRLWEIAAGKCERTMKTTGGAISVAFSPDQCFAVSGSFHNTVEVWDLRSGKCLRTLKGHKGRVWSVVFSADSRFLLSGSGDGTARLWELEWEYEFPDPIDWDESAKPYLENFLTLHTPYASDDPTSPEGLTRRGRPSWTQEDFQGLIRDLQYAGYGWLRPEGVKHELEKMASTWEGPPPLPGE